MTPLGAMYVRKSQTSGYTSANVPIEANMVILTRGVRITDENGVDTPIRGVRVSVVDTGITAPVTPIDNVPFVWKEGTAFVFSSTGTYTFYDDGLVAYGARII